MPPKTVRAVIYARYSTDLQNPLSVKDQIAKCRRYAAAKGWAVVGEYGDNAMSGGTSARPDYKRLLGDLPSGTFDTILVESLDRLSRDVEDTAHLYKRTRHHDINVHTLGSGDQGMLQMCFAGLMGSIFLETLAEHTHRGVEARVQKGFSGGGRSYGYAVPRDANGDRITGALVIDADEANVVKRIFKDYAAGMSPIKIAAALNAEGVPAPRSGRETDTHWRQNTINGSRARGTGILNNELYIGRRVWDRQKYRKHPDTGKRVAIPRPRAEWQITDVPDLRIIDDDLWARVKARQGDLRQSQKRDPDQSRNGIEGAHGTRRRRYLLSGLLECGQCGGKLIIAGPEGRRHYYCASHKQKGASICAGMPGVRQAEIEALVFELFQRDLMTDTAYAEFRDRLSAQLKAQQSDIRDTVRDIDKRLKAARRRHEGLMSNIESGRVPQSVFDRLEATEAEIAELEAARAAAEPDPIELPENLPELWRAQVADLSATLGAGEVVGRASEQLRGMIERLVVRFDPETGCQSVELHGNLARMLGTADTRNAARYEASRRSLSLVAGAGFEPAAFRL